MEELENNDLEQNYDNTADEISEIQEEQFKHMPIDLACSEKHTKDYVENGFDNNKGVCTHEAGKRNTVDNDEEETDQFCILEENKEKYQQFFMEDWELAELTLEQYDIFKDIIQQEMYAPKSTRLKGNAIRLKKSVHNYLKWKKLVSSPDTLENKKILKADPLFSVAEIEQIIQINKQIFNVMRSDLSQNNRYRIEAEYFFKRGLNTKEFIVADNFQELDTINSYTLSNSVGEQFATSNNGYISIIRVPISICEENILFNSLVFPSLSGERQYEFGIIPFPNRQKLSYLGPYRKVRNEKGEEIPLHEYELNISQP